MQLERRTGTAADMVSMFHLSGRALRPHVEANFGRWDETEQRGMFFRSTDPSTHELLFDGDILIGYLWVARSPDKMYLHRITIAPEYQNRGIGTMLIRQLLDEARRLRVPMRLQVFPNNPAHRLYSRLGFREESRTPTHIQMVFRQDTSRQECERDEG